MLQVDSLNNSCFKKLQYHERKFRLQLLQKSSSLEKVAVPKVNVACENVYNCSSKKMTILNE